MIMTQGEVRICAQRGTKLFDCHYRSVSILIRASQQNMRKRCVWIQLDRLLEFVRSLRILILREIYERDVKVDVRSIWTQALGALQGLQRILVISFLKIDKTKP